MIFYSFLGNSSYLVRLQEYIVSCVRLDGSIFTDKLFLHFNSVPVHYSKCKKAICSSSCYDSYRIQIESNYIQNDFGWKKKLLQLYFLWHFKMFQKVFWINKNALFNDQNTGWWSAHTCWHISSPFFLISSYLSHLLFCLSLSLTHTLTLFLSLSHLSLSLSFSLSLSLSFSLSLSLLRHSLVKKKMQLKSPLTNISQISHFLKSIKSALLHYISQGSDQVIFSCSQSYKAVELACLLYKEKIIDNKMT